MLHPVNGSDNPVIDSSDPSAYTFSDCFDSATHPITHSLDASSDTIGNSINAIGNGADGSNDTAGDPACHCIRDCANTAYSSFSHARNRGSDVNGVAKAVDDVAQGVGVLEDLIGQAVIVLSPVRLLVIVSRVGVPVVFIASSLLRVKTNCPVHKDRYPEGKDDPDDSKTNS